jgi:hypothetical protein
MPPRIEMVVGIIHTCADASKQERLEQEAGPRGAGCALFAVGWREFVSRGVWVGEYSRGRCDGDYAEMGGRDELLKGGVHRGLTRGSQRRLLSWRRIRCRERRAGKWGSG